MADPVERPQEGERRNPTKGTETYRRYRRTAIAEIADWHPDFDMSRVSVSDADRDAGSPKAGDKIARNPKNHDDRWLIAADYFADNFEAVANPAPQGVTEPTDSDFERILKANGEAGSVEVNPDGSPCYQHFVAQAGPFREGTPVAVIGEADAEKILAALLARPHTEPPREDGWVPRRSPDDDLLGSRELQEIRASLRTPHDSEENDDG